jgi:methionyl-tRNA formyltransferase
VLAARRPEDHEQPSFLALTASSAPQGLDLLFARDKHAIERLLRALRARPGDVLGLSLEDPQAALDVPRPRLDQPAPRPAAAPPWADPACLGAARRRRRWGSTWHRMDSELDTGNVLVQTTVRSRTTTSTSRSSGRGSSQPASRRCRARSSASRRRPGRSSAAEGASWAGHFEDDEYARVDWSQPARAIHNQVRAWHLTFGLSGVRAPVADLDGEQVVLLQTRLTDPGGDARRVECGDGPIWVVASEPV